MNLLLRPSSACIHQVALQPSRNGATRPTRLLQVLREVQEHDNYLPEPALEQVARRRALPLSQVRGVAAFYDFLSLQPTGVYRVLFSDDVIDRMRGSTGAARSSCASACGRHPAG